MSNSENKVSGTREILHFHLPACYIYHQSYNNFLILPQRLYDDICWKFIDKNFPKLISGPFANYLLNEAKNIANNCKSV